ncbi:major histocompatibility complex class I-related gene protein-like isoform X1 [Gadus morhua]|uniref:major histocompatibility complex class I-related gene protein-like isoform X1 n=1 Tax=Gadus morhua TaxID=8049 RepID=UPI0011B477D5|nr:major histocompatibility complex class I-related gene protein-like isoform X1 [Gadus morhua]
MISSTTDSSALQFQYSLMTGFLVSRLNAGVGDTSLWIISPSSSSEYIDMKAIIGLLLLVFGHGVSSVIHSLHYFYTASSGLSTFPEFVAVGMLDEVQIGYYDSNSKRIVMRQDWMEQFLREHPGELERNTGRALGAQHSLKAEIVNLKRAFNQTGGTHLYQNMYGCEWDDEDGTTDGYEQFGYDGEDYLVLDLKTLTWVAPVRQAFTTKLRWDGDRAELQYLKYYYTKQCVDSLKKLLAYGKSTLQRTERPRVSLLQRSPSSPVVCHATGFYPDRVVVFWRRDGQELHEQVDPGEVLPNHDGTFQVSVDLNLKAVPQEDWGRYECVVQLRGIEEISTLLDPDLIRTNGEDQSGLTIPIIIGFLVPLLAAASAVVGVFVYQKRNGSDTSSENTEGQNSAPEAQPLTTVQS